MLGTCLVESALRYVKQLGTGPALGLPQMERATHDDIWANFLRYQPQLRADIVKCSSYFTGEHPDATELIGNMNYAVAMCRAHYRRQKPALPSNALGLALYHKRYYNSPLGATDVAVSVRHFEFAIATE